MAKILFNCPGTTDPIRGNHDGPILHILRKYRPDVVVNLMSTEMYRIAQSDERYQLLRMHLKEAWSYEPEWVEEVLEIANPSKLDLLYDVMQPVLKRYLKRYAADEILVNLSSGTPQMQIMMMDLALDMRYHCTGVQVTNPDKTSGRAPRTNTDVYDILTELEENLDELDGYEDRCVEPKLISVRRKNQWEQLESILKLRDFEAAAKMKRLMPENARKMADHLLQRSRLNNREAREIMQQKELYPIRFRREDKNVEKLCEYYLILRNMQKSDRIPEFVLRLNPFIVELQICLIDVLLRNTGRGFCYSMLTDEDGRFWVDKLRQQDENLLEQIDAYFARKGGVRDGVDSNITLGNGFLACLGAEPGDMVFFADCEKLNSRLRNPLAHELEHATEEDVKHFLGYGSDRLIRQIEELLPRVFTQYNAQDFRDYFRVYDFGIRYIEKTR